LIRLGLSRWSTLFVLPFLSILMHSQAKPELTSDVVIFTNGDQLSGVLLRQVGDSVVFRSEMAGEITIPLTRIKDLRTSGKFAVLRKGVPIEASRRVMPERVEITPSGLTLPDRGLPDPVVPLTSVAYIVDAATFENNLVRTPNFFEGWLGTATLGATVFQGTQHGGTVTGNVALTRQVPPLAYFRPRNRMIVNVEETFGKSTTPVIPQTTPESPDAVVKTSIFHADAERDEYIAKRRYLLAATSFDHNFGQGLDLQQLYGTGFGFTWFSDAKQQLDLKIDVHYLKQQFFDPGSNQNLIGSSFSESYRRSLPQKIQLTQTFNIIPSWNQLRAYSSNGSLAVVLPVAGRFSFSTTVTDAFLNNPSPGYRKNSLTISAGITYVLK
jgi:hypothetical protein